MKIRTCNIEEAIEAVKNRGYNWHKAGSGAHLFKSHAGARRSIGATIGYTDAIIYPDKNKYNEYSGLYGVAVK